jgi:hypothetical protein
MAFPSQRLCRCAGTLARRWSALTVLRALVFALWKIEGGRLEEDGALSPILPSSEVVIDSFLTQRYRHCSGLMLLRWGTAGNGKIGLTPLR